MLIFSSNNALSKLDSPVPATGVKASFPPIILGAIKEYTLSTNLLLIKEKLNMYSLEALCLR